MCIRISQSPQLKEVNSGRNSSLSLEQQKIAKSQIESCYYDDSKWRILRLKTTEEDPTGAYVRTARKTMDENLLEGTIPTDPATSRG